MKPGVVDVADVDLFADDVLDDPYPVYGRLRQAGPVMWSRCHDVWVVPGYAEVRAVLRDWRSFSSAAGTAMDDGVNRLRAGNIISTDPPEHEALRGVLAAQLSARALGVLHDDIESRARAMVDTMLTNGGGDVVTELAEPLPLNVVADLVGFPTEGRQSLLGWVEASFNTFGPMNQRTRDSIPLLEGVWRYLRQVAEPGRLAPGGLGEAIFSAAVRGDVTDEQRLPLLFAYATAGIDTTVNALSSALWLLGTHDDQWQALRDDPTLATGAFNETLRLEAPIQCFTRMAGSESRIGQVDVPAGARVLVLFGSANRDERKWAEPERFDIRRPAADHVAFGYGVHSCAGQYLARLEGQIVLSVLARTVSNIRVVSVERKRNNVLRGFRHLQVELR